MDKMSRRRKNMGGSKEEGLWGDKDTWTGFMRRPKQKLKRRRRQKTTMNLYNALHGGELSISSPDHLILGKEPLVLNGTAESGC